MKTKKHHGVESADVADLAQYRARLRAADASTTSATSSQQERVDRVREAVLAQIDSLGSPPIAFATVLLSQDGTVTLAATGIEPEFAPAIESGLLDLQSRIRAHRLRNQPRPRGSAGRIGMIPLLSTAFLAAIFINQIAWVDVALSLAAQLTIGLSLNPRRRNG